MSNTGGAKTTIIDAQGLILGRMASLVAKKLLNGETVFIVNARDAVISGKRRTLVQEAKEFLQVGHFRKGPLHPRRPDNIVKKVVRGMLPRKSPKGKEALKRLKVFIGTPQDLADKEKVKLVGVEASDLRCPYIKVSELARAVGWKE